MYIYYSCIFVFYELTAINNFFCIINNIIDYGLYQTNSIDVDCLRLIENLKFNFPHNNKQQQIYPLQ